MQVTVHHVDTCLPDYVLDHCNGDNETLFGVMVDGSTTYEAMRCDLLNDMLANADAAAEAGVSDEALVDAVAECFADADDANVFDASLDVLTDDYTGECCYAWFRLSWEV